MQTQINPVHYTSNKFCGPAALSAITGMDTATAAREIRSRSGQGIVKGSAPRHVLAVLASLGYHSKEVFHCYHGGDFREWAAETAEERGDQVYLLVAGNHFRVVQGDKYVCGLTRAIVDIKDAPVSARCNAKTTEIYRITKREEVALPTPYKVVDEQAKARRDAKKIMEKYGLEVERESTGGHQWIYYIWNKENTNSLHLYQTAHYDWYEILATLEEAIRELNN
tara:strand:+ start:280 stop:951 length:672 start_codon:yes stop_codon:yes gene_type:complete